MKPRLKPKKPGTLLIILLAGLSLILTACQPTAQKATKKDDALLVTVSVIPQAYFVERIGGDAVSVNFMVGPGEEAHTYEPKPEQMKALNDSQVFFSIGIEYEETWLPRFMDINPDLLFVDSAEGVQRIGTSETHPHLDEDENHTEGLDPHIWLAPDNAKIIATNILNALIDLAPDQAEAFQVNYDVLITDIDTLDAQIIATIAGLEQRTFMVFHPAWGYFANQYDLEQIAVQVGGQDPSASELAELVKIAREKNIQVVFVQPTFSTIKAQAIAQEINAEVTVVDPLARDWLGNLEIVAQAFASALSN